MADLAQLSLDWDFFVRCSPPWDGIIENDEYRFHRWKRQVVQSQLMPPPRHWWSSFIYGRRLHRATKVIVADSHRFAERVLALSGEGIARLLHVDAHHDLGYDDETTLDCGNWLRFVMERRPNIQVRVIYPDWKGLQDLQRRDRPWASDTLLTRRLSFGCWSTEQLFIGDELITKIFICRSSAWTHPRHDRAFCHFVEEVCQSICTEPLTPFVAEEGINSLEPRL